MYTGNLPLTLAEISVDWLNTVLCEPQDLPPVIAMKSADASSGTTGRAVLELEYESDSPLPSRLFVKLPPDDPAQRAFVTEVGMGKREADFYRLLSDEVPVRVPRSYFSASDEAGERYIMLLEDLGETGCTFRNASTRYSRDYISEVLRSFARLHAYFWESDRFSGDLEWVVPPGMHPAGPGLVKRALEQFAGDMPAAFTELGAFYVEHAPQVHELWTRGVPTLVHGDIHDGNMFYDPSIPAPGMLDWAIVGRTSCMRDVGYFLAATPTPEDRQACQREWLEFYCGELGATGVNAPPMDELWQQYRWHIAYVWVAGVTTLAMGSEWQPVNYVERTMARLNRAIVDLDCLGALQEGLH